MVPERIYLPDCRRRTELRARYRNDCRIVTLRPEKGFQQTELTVEDPVGRMDIREEMEMANRTVVHKSRRRGICIVLREVTIVLIGMGMQAFARIGREQDQQQRPRIEYPYEFCPLISGAKIMKKVTRQGALSQIPIYWDASAGNQISISRIPNIPFSSGINGHRLRIYSNGQYNITTASYPKLL